METAENVHPSTYTGQHSGTSCMDNNIGQVEYRWLHTENVSFLG